MVDRRIRKSVMDESTPTGIRIDLYCPDCGKRILSRLAKTCPSCNSQVIESTVPSWRQQSKGEERA